MLYPSQATYEAYASLGDTIKGKLPFSYFFAMTNTWSSLQASTTANLPNYNLNLHDLGIGSTTVMGNFLPNFDAFSSSTVSHYLSPSLLGALKGLASIALIAGLFTDIFFTVKRLPKT